MSDAHTNPDLRDAPLSEEWLARVGFKWHQFDRQPTKHWLLWLGDAVNGGRAFCSYEDLGVEVASGLDDTWFCWLRDDAGGRYSRFIHIRHLRTRRDLVELIQGVTGQTFDPANNLYGSMVTPERAAFIRAQDERLDRRLRTAGHPWRDVERDDTRGRPLTNHMQAAIDAGKAK